MDILSDIGLIIFGGLIAGIVCRVLNQPAIVGYILVGVALGPLAGELAIRNPEDLSLLAEIGIALLLFSVGIEFSLAELFRMWRIAIIGTTIQIGLVIAAAVGLGVAFGWSPQKSLWAGAMISLSSTMVVLKVQAEGRFESSLSGRVMTAMLIMQDLALLPLMIILPQLGGEIDWSAVFGSLAKAAGLLILFALIGLRTIPALMQRIVLLRSRELFLLAVVTLGLGVGYVVHLAGLSFAVGAFIAGLVLSESDFGHQALSDVIPLRDIFGLMFFASVGMLLDPGFVARNLHFVLATIALVVVGKGLVFAGVTRAFGYRNIVPLASALTMAQIGELSFLLARLGIDVGAVDQQLYNLVISTAVATMILTPYLSRLSGPAYEWYKKRRPARQTSLAPLQTSEPPAVLIVGAGRVGSRVAAALKLQETPFTLIDYDWQRIRQAAAEGYSVMFGDGSQEPILVAAGLDKVRLVVVSLPDAASATLVVRRVRQLRPDVHIIARAETAAHAEMMYKLGVYEVVQPEFEAALEMARQSLLHLDVPPGEIQRFLDALRRDTFTRPDATHPSWKSAEGIRRAVRSLDLHWVQLGPQSPLIDRTLGEAALRTRTGLTLVAVIRGTEIIHNPDVAFRFAAGDWLGLIGSAEQINHFCSEFSGRASSAEKPADDH